MEIPGGWGELAGGLPDIPISLCKATGDEVGFFWQVLGDSSACCTSTEIINIGSM